jgi:hypothetical protein
MDDVLYNNGVSAIMCIVVWSYEHIIGVTPWSPVHTATARPYHLYFRVWPNIAHIATVGQ